MSAKGSRGRRQPTTPTTNQGEDMAKRIKPVELVDDAAQLGEGHDLTAIRTTINPREVIQVGAAELLDLTRQGLVYETDQAEESDDEPNGEDDELDGDDKTEGF